MRIRDIYEAPIGDWTIDSDFDANEREMVSKFTGYEREGKHWSDVDKRALRDPSVVQKVRSAFMKTPSTFDLYFWQSTDPKYDRTLEKGTRDHKWIVDKLGPKAGSAIQAKSGVITVVMTNNLSDDRKVSMRSPWMVAHRIAHALIGGGAKTGAGWEANNEFESFAARLCKLAYGVPWPTKYASQFDTIMYGEHIEAYMPVLGHMLGTMKSARSGHLVQASEWEHETFVQYLSAGNLTNLTGGLNLGGYGSAVTQNQNGLQVATTNIGLSNFNANLSAGATAVGNGLTVKTAN